MKDIVIEYLLAGNTEWQKIKLKPEEYFDPLDEDETEYKVNSVDKHFLEPRNYINAKPADIIFLNIYIEDEKSNREETRYTYWDNGNNQIHEIRTLKNDVLVNRIILLNVYVDNQKDKNLILRFDENEKQLFPVTHSILAEKSEQNTDFESVDLNEFKRFLL